ncbi:unnamed protein product, partial [Discosporangium mesarthrocarpum]
MALLPRKMRSIWLFLPVMGGVLLLLQAFMSVSLGNGPLSLSPSKSLGYMVAFTDPTDPLVLERASALHQSLIESLLLEGGGGEEGTSGGGSSNPNPSPNAGIQGGRIMALVPRIPEGHKMVQPLEE